MFRDSMVALVTPMRPDISVDFAALERLVNWHIEEGTSCIVSMGTTGESATLDIPEHIEVVRQTVQFVNGRIKVMAGAGGNSTTEAIELTQRSEAVGADGILSVVPYYNKPPQRGIVAHFTKIAESTDLPIVLYNVPSRTVTDMSNDTVVELSSIDNIVGLKDATGDLERHIDLKARVGEDFGLFSGDDATSCEYLLMGGHGVISVTANIAPRHVAMLCEQARKGDNEGARATDAIIADLHRDLFVEPNPMAPKWALMRMGFMDDYIRLPLVPLDKKHHNTVEAAMLKAGINVDKIGE